MKGRDRVASGGSYEREQNCDRAHSRLSKSSSYDEDALKLTARAELEALKAGDRHTQRENAGGVSTGLNRTHPRMRGGRRRGFNIGAD